MRRLRVAWSSHKTVLPGGQAFGYTTASVNLMNALAQRPDVEITDFADVAVHFAHPHNFHPELFPHRINVLFTMYELSPCPPEFGRGMAKADAVVTPSLFSKGLLERARMPEGTTRPPIYVSRLGLDVERFPLARRPAVLKPSDKFRVLWIGAPNQRKGYHILADEWFWFADVPWMELTMKSAVARQDKAEVKRQGNMLWDERRKTRAEMAELYTGHHLFVFPTLGEGFGLTPLEAAATGMPVLTTNHSSQAEFLREKDGHLLVATVPHQVRTSTGIISDCRRSEPGAVAKGIKTMMREWPERSRRAYNAAARLRREYSWGAAAEELLGVLRRVMDGERRAAA